MAIATVAPAAQATKRAFSYLRVSSDEQVNTDYSRDGLSLMAQRTEAQERAAQLGARILHEYSDPGRSAYQDLHKRADFLAMLAEIKRRGSDPATRIDYVIVWAVNRFARDTVDHWQARKLLRTTGTRLISITEPIVGEDSPAAFLYESTIVSQSQYSSMQSGEQIKRGIRTKASLGGTYGPARLGYCNVREVLPDGRKVASVELDPERHHFLTLGFQLYDSGEYSIPQLTEEMYRLGLRSRPMRSKAAGKVGISTWHRILHNPYYAGWLVYKRGTPQEQIVRGRHEALIDQDTFDRVQVRLAEMHHAGERPQVQQHYLRGTVFCGVCGRRLMYGKTTGKTGKRYPYYFCSSRVSGDRKACAMRASINPAFIETELARYYRDRPVQLSATDVQRRTAAIEALAATSQQAVMQVREAKSALIGKLKAQQTRLLRLHLEGDDASPDAFREERARLQTEITAAEQSLAETEARLAIDAAQLRMALELADDVAAVYAAADEGTRRSLNQAFFRKVLVMPEWDEDSGERRALVAGAELTDPYAALLADDLVDEVLAEAEAIRQRSERAEDASGETPSAVSIFLQMVETAGIEPASAVA